MYTNKRWIIYYYLLRKKVGLIDIPYTVDIAWLFVTVAK